MLDQEDDPELDDEWFTDDEHLTSFCKAREKIVERFKGSESPFGQRTKSSEEDLGVREKVPIKNKGPSVRETGTNGNYALIDQAQNEGSIGLNEKCES